MLLVSLLIAALCIVVLRIDDRLKRIQRELTSVRLLGEFFAEDQGVSLDRYDEAFAEVWGTRPPADAAARRAMRERAHRTT